MNTTDQKGLSALQEQRGELRSRLAQAWELRQPLEQIRDIENQIRTLWDEIDRLDPCPE